METTRSTPPEPGAVQLGTDPHAWYCYAAIEFVGDDVLLDHCEYHGLNSLQVTRLPVSWLYKSTTTD